MRVLIRNWPHNHHNDPDHRSDENIPHNRGQGISDILSQSIISSLSFDSPIVLTLLSAPSQQHFYQGSMIMG